MKIKGVLFDLDGTLLNTLPDLAFISNITMKEAGYPTHTEEEVRWFVGNGVEVLFRKSLPEGLELSREEFDTLFAKMRANYLKYQNRLTELYDGIEEMLRDLKEMGVKTAIVTNKMDSAAKEVAERYFPGLIDYSIGTMEGMRIKPYPDEGLKALEILGLEAGECIYVGDSDTDIETGNNLYMPVLSCAWGFRGEEFLREHGAVNVIHHPKEIVDYIKYTETL